MLVSLGVGRSIISHLPLRLGRFVFCNPSVLAGAARKFPCYHGNTDVGVDTEPGSWKAAQSRASGRPPVHASCSKTEPADCAREEQSGLLHLPRLAYRRREWEVYPEYL